MSPPPLTGDPAVPMEKAPLQQQQDKNTEGSESGEVHQADEVPASSPAKRSKPSGKVAASPKPKKTRDASPLPAPKRAKKPLPSQDSEIAGASAEADPAGARSPKRSKKPTSPQEGEKEKEKEKEKGKEEEGKAGLPADETVVTSPAPDPSGQVATSPRNKKKGLKRRKNSSLPQEKEVPDARVNNAARYSLRKPSSKRRSGNSSKRDEQASKGGEVEKVPAGDASLLQEEQCTPKEQAEEGGADKSVEALPERNVSSPKPSDSKKEKKPALGRLWSMKDELQIVTALAVHAEDNNGVLPDTTSLFTNLLDSFDRRDADADKLGSKVRKLKVWYDRMCSQGCPDDDHGHMLFDMCGRVWGTRALQNSSHGGSVAPRRSLRNTINSKDVVPQVAHQDGGGGGELMAAPNSAPARDVFPPKDSAKLLIKDQVVVSGNFEDNVACLDKDKQVSASSGRRELNVLYALYPSLVEVVKEYAETHGSGNLILGALEKIGDDKARYLDARCKKQSIDLFNLYITQAELTKAILSTLGCLIN